MDDKWHLNRIGAPEAWETTSGDGIVVAVLDTGIDQNNQNLSSRVVGEVNFTNSSTSNDLYGHGTQMASTITDIAPACSLLNVKVADKAGKAQTSVVARGVRWAVDNGANVINMSLGVPPSSDLEQAINYARSKGVLVVAAAGNDGSSTPTYPASYANCLAVAATGESDCLALFSNHGDSIDLAAPGVSINSTWLNNEYEVKSGTSAAAAVVSGVAALVFSAATATNVEGLVNDKVRQAIENSCSPINADGVGKGRINALEAVRKVASSGSDSS